MTGPETDTPTVSQRMNVHMAWLRCTTPETVLDETARRLGQGVPADELWAAGALTACRYLNNQAYDFSGHASRALPNCAEARRLGHRQSTRLHHLLLLLSLYQVTADLQNPCLGPYELLPTWPFPEETVAETMAQLRHDVRSGDYMCADHRFMALAERMPSAQLFDLLVDMGLEKTGEREHALTSLLAYLELIEVVGWQRGVDMLRWFVRYCGSCAVNMRPYNHAVELLAANNLEQGAPNDTLQRDLVEPVCAAFRAVEPNECAELAAQAMRGDRISPVTVLTALVRIVCEYVLTHDWIPRDGGAAADQTIIPFYLSDALRGVRAALPYMAPRTQALAAIHASNLLMQLPFSQGIDRQRSVRTAVIRAPIAADNAAPELQTYSAPALLDVIRTALYAHDDKRAMSAIRAYADADGPPVALIALLTEASLTHSPLFTCNVKHLHSMVWEFQRADSAERWKFLQLAAKRVAIYAGLNDELYRQADQALRNHAT